MAPAGVPLSKPPIRCSQPPVSVAGGLAVEPAVPPEVFQSASPDLATSVAGFAPSLPAGPVSPFCGAEPWTVAPVEPVAPGCAGGARGPRRAGLTRLEQLLARTLPASLSLVIVAFLMSRP